MRYPALLALAFASVSIPLNSPQGSKPITPRSGPRAQLNTPNPSGNPKDSELTNTKIPYQSELNDRAMIKFFVSIILAFKIFKNRHQFIPEIPIPSNLVTALLATNIVAGAAADKVPKPNPSNLQIAIAKTNNNLNSTKPISQAKLLGDYKTHQDFYKTTQIPKLDSSRSVFQIKDDRNQNQK